jgi:hypothetical protein
MAFAVAEKIRKKEDEAFDGGNKANDAPAARKIRARGNSRMENPEK